MRKTHLQLIAAAVVLCNWLGFLDFYGAPYSACNLSVAQAPTQTPPKKAPPKTPPPKTPAPTPPPAQKPPAKSYSKRSASKPRPPKPVPPPKVPPHDVVTRDWDKYPAVLQLHASADIAAVGDVHGDYKRLVKLLAVANLIAEPSEKPELVKWTGSRTVLVCTGDLIDKGSHSMDVLACFRTLQPQASEAGGAVVVTMGNHEAEFLAYAGGDKKGEKFMEELAHANVAPKDVVDGKDPLGVGNFMRNLPFAALIDDWFFAHACSTQGKKFSSLNLHLKDVVTKKGFAVPELLGPRGLLEARLTPIPWWEQATDKHGMGEGQARLRHYADTLYIKHFVMGHQPGDVHFEDGSKRKAGEMVQKFDGLIFLIDVGMSEAVHHSQGVMLMIHRENGGEIASSLDVQEKKTRLWPAVSPGETTSPGEKHSLAEGTSTEPAK